MSVMLPVLHAPYPNGPKMPSPVFFGKDGEFLLQTARGSTLETLDQIAQPARGWVLNMDMHMIFADDTFQDAYVLGIANLFDQVTAANLHISFQNMIAVLCHPHDVYRQPGHRMARPSVIISHKTNIGKWVATESLALKVHSFN